MSDTPRRDLAGRPQAQPHVSPTAPVTAAATACLRGSPPGAAAGCPGRGPTAGGATAAPGTAATAGASAGARPVASARTSYRPVFTLADPAGDQGLEGPAYGDLRSVSIGDGGRDARVTVELAGRLPSPTASRESLGVGVDLFDRPGQIESDYQLFADGTPDGWYAYLHTPRGFVRYPGTFAVTGDRLVFTVPWSSLGGRTGGYVSAFVDWTRGGTAGTLGGNRASRDEAPGLGTRAWSR